MKPRTDRTAAASTSVTLDLLRAEVVRSFESVRDDQRELQTALPYLSFIRSVRPTELGHGILEPSMCLVVQGRKRMLIGSDVATYGAGAYVVSAIDIPVSGQVTEASRSRPYLGVRIDIDPKEVAALMIDTGITVAPKGRRVGAYIEESDAGLQDAFLRLVRLLDAPADLAALGKFTKQEILYRLLKAHDGDVLGRTVLAHAQERGVKQAIDWIKQNYARPMKIEQLARAVGMSVSSLHHRFKAVTVLSPLQYQKQVRLLEARRLLLAGDAEAATVAFSVGYESPSQFSREYRRLFGAPPRRDVEHMRNEDVVH